MFFNGISKVLFMNFFGPKKIGCAKTIRRFQKTFRRPENHFSTRCNVYWSNKKSFNEKARCTSENENFEKISNFWQIFDETRCWRFFRQIAMNTKNVRFSNSDEFFDRNFFIRIKILFIL